ncbi:MAG: 16S rRNA (adenine(1518)-N(6)/adenine(1519)-N(6))-dimethyltransferase RsmA [Candidatus Saccharimonadales bacterium]
MSDIIPKKSLGQHWLKDSTILKAICDDAQVTARSEVLEIGPGLGTLTRELLRRGASVTAVEFDSTLAQNLTKNLTCPNPDNLEVEPLDLGDLQHLTVVGSDILRFNLQQLPKGYCVVANIPYYLTSNLIRVLCESSNPFSTAALLIQKEVAERVCAAPGAMSLLSVSAQYYCEVSLGTYVPRELFVPPPKVDSRVLILRYRSSPLFPDVDTKQFFHLVRSGFSQKRKTLHNSLSAGLGISREEAAAILTRASIDPQRRAQTLSLEEWRAIYLNVRVDI